MSVRVMTWVWQHSRAKPVPRLVLLAIADCANDTGAEAYPSTAALARKTALSERGVRAAVTGLVELGELRVDYKTGPKGCNRYRVIMSDPAGSAGSAEPGPVPDPAPRAGSTRQDLPGTRNDMPGVDPEARAGYLAPRAGSDPLHPAPRARNPARRAPEPLKPSSGSSEEVTHSSSANASPTRRTPPQRRDDVERVCAYLADKIEANGSKRPTVTQRWRDAARLMIDVDGRNVDKIMRAIDWCQADEFWRANVLSMPTLRERYDRLRLAAQRNGGARASPKPSTTDQRVSEGLALAERFDAEQPKEITA